MPHRYAIANWKMNLPPEGLDTYIDALNTIDQGAAAIVIAPPYPYLAQVASRGRDKVATAAQNCADHEKGAFTGEVAPSMIRDAGARFVILGHSERRSLYDESDAVIARKLALALASGLTPVLCIGEDLRTRDMGNVKTHLADQLRASAVAELEGGREVIIAYEPIWAIGTGRNASGAMVAETIEHIREALRRFWPARFAEGGAILYGGSVTPENAPDLMKHGQIDGFLVGGASLDSAKLKAIHAAIR